MASDFVVGGDCVDVVLAALGKFVCTANLYRICVVY